MSPDALFKNCFNALAFPNFAWIGGNFRAIWSFQSITPLAMIVGWFASRHRDNDGVFGGRGCVTQLKMLLGWFFILGKGMNFKKDLKRSGNKIRHGLKITLNRIWMVLLSMLLKKMEEVIHKMKNGIDAYKHVDEEGRGVDSGGRIQEYDEDGYKGSHPERKVQFF